MRITILSIIDLISFNFSYSQTVNGFALNEIPADYIEVVLSQKGLKLFQYDVYVDYGQISKMSEQKNGWILGEDGKKIGLNGKMGAINLLSQNGWEYVNAILVTSGSSNVYRYIMRKNKTMKNYLFLIMLIPNFC